MSPKTTTSAAPNPLQRRPLTPAEYAALHHTVQAKASRALLDLNAKLEVELRAQYDAAERANAVLAGEVERLEGEGEELEARRMSLSNRAKKLRERIARYEADAPQLNDAHSAVVRAERDEAIQSTEELSRELGRARREEKRVRGLLNSTKDRIANLTKFIEDGDDDGAKRLLAMDNELVERRRRKSAERAGADLSSVTPLAG